ncbi:NAD(P)H-hydrate dehydratase [Vitreoscilla massiliensis]|uniref:ADP-dependent (S)-NAD(P)H-hydrate dehydratase n=1 Tax=Vitreoscilla massiliensis TaxID=1689272 RepID=A0ABY4DZD7_9NEIS|nr:NAD(P)H-hydrate dehydratase [Vitreoscilla massiliensis]UOO88490.1 NAD(P)H-hydrate dehydratase [Vitreoscilla massiliensis]
MWETYQHFARQHFPELCQQRPVDSHKGTFGTVAIIGGNIGMSGAVIMAARAALKLGAGKVKIGFAQDSLPLPVLENQPEIMLYTADALLQHQDISAWSIGCGLDTDTRALHTMHLARERFQTDTHAQVVWDADALNLFSLHEDLQAAIQSQHIITPHPTEAARLLHTTTASIQADRKTAVAQLQQRFGCISVLKGHHSLVQVAAQNAYVNLSGNAGLATAGSGDILSGFMTSLLAQGMDADIAAPAAVWLHAAAAEVLALQKIGPIGMVATELIDAARFLRNQLSVAIEI